MPRKSASSGKGQGRGLSSDKLGEIVAAVRALCVIYNTSLTYQTDHAVFKKAVDERIDLFHTALKGLAKLSLFFADGNVRADALPLDPGSAMFQKLAHRFESLGVQCLDFLPAISPADLTAFIEIVTMRSDDIPRTGLQQYLKAAGIRSIVERKVKAQMLGPDDEVTNQQSARTGSTAHTHSHTAAWDLDGSADMVSLSEMDFSDASAMRSFNTFVEGALGVLSRQEAEMRDVAEIIATEFERRVTEKVDEVRVVAQKRARRLESIRDLVLRELESVHLAAIIVDSNLNVLAANSLGRKLVGNIAKLDEGSPLERFIMSGKEKEDVELDDSVRSAHLLTSQSRDGGNAIMLISLE